MLTNDNTQVWADGKGVRDKHTAIRDLDDWTLNSYSLSNFKVRLDDPDPQSERKVTNRPTRVTPPSVDES